MSKKTLYNTCKAAIIPLICKEKHYISLLDCQGGNCWTTFLSSSDLDSTTVLLGDVFYQLPSYHCHLHFSIRSTLLNHPIPFVSLLFCCFKYTTFLHISYLLALASLALGSLDTYHYRLLPQSFI